jgi:hypothetical protein
MTAAKLWATVWQVDERWVILHVFASRPRHPDQSCGRVVFERATWDEGVGEKFMAGITTTDPNGLLSGRRD